MSAIRLQQKNYQLEGRVMEGYAVTYRAYLARRDLPGPEPTFADFVEIRKLQEKIARTERARLGAFAVRAPCSGRNLVLAGGSASRQGALRNGDVPL
jgi:hypothetical protein